MMVYLDNNIVCGTKKQDIFPHEEREALNLLLEHEKAGKIEMKVSRIAIQEIDRTRNKELREVLRRHYETFETVANEHKVKTFHNQSDQYGGFISYPIMTEILDEEVFFQLCQMGLERMDALHLVMAIFNKAEVFLTADPDFFKLREEIRNRFSIRVMKPTELVKELSNVRPTD